MYNLLPSVKDIDAVLPLTRVTVTAAGVDCGGDSCAGCCIGPFELSSIDNDRVSKCKLLKLVLGPASRR